MDEKKIPASRADLEQLIQAQIEENSSLEYKSAVNRKYPKLRDDMTGDVSAFANAAGGILIYGIKEFDASDKRHLPEKITPIDATEYSREWFDHILGQIQPRIAGLSIRPIHVGPAPSDFCFVVVVPPGETAHQATDLRYHRRRNFEVTAMEDYEVREAMGRRKHPKLSVMAQIFPATGLKRRRIIFNVKNEGAVMAKNYCLVVCFPYDLGDGPIGFTSDNAFFATEGGESFWRVTLTNNLFSPLFPQATHHLEQEIDRVTRFVSPPAANITQLRIRAYADSMQPQDFVKDVAAVIAGWA